MKFQVIQHKNNQDEIVFESDDISEVADFILKILRENPNMNPKDIRFTQSKTQH